MRAAPISKKKNSDNRLKGETLAKVDQNIAEHIRKAVTDSSSFRKRSVTDAQALASIRDDEL